MHVDQILASPITWIVVAAASEVIALSPMKDNSIVQLVLHVLDMLKAKRTDPTGGALVVAFFHPIWMEQRATRHSAAEV